MRDPKPVDVKVFIDNPATDPPQFHFETTHLPMGPNNHLHFQNCGHPGFYVHYHLQDPTHGYVFPEESMYPHPPGPKDEHLNQALYSAVGTACPTSSGQWGQFTALRVENAGRTLVVWNKNESPVDFGYTLRVTSNGGQNYLPLDPGGTNTNGPSLYALTTTTLMVAGAAATATFFAVTSLAGNFVEDGAIRLGTALLAALTVGFGIAALWERFR